MSKNVGYHPNIGSIIRIRDQIYQSLYVDNHPIEALRQMNGLLTIIEQDDRNTELEEKIRTETEYYQTTRSIHKKQQRQKHRQKTYNQWFKKINDILYEGKYLVNEKYQPFRLEKDEVDFK